jgi:hypothetical protein
MLWRCLFYYATRMSIKARRSRFSLIENRILLVETNSIEWWVRGGLSLAGYLVDRDNGGRLRAAADNRGPPALATAGKL